MASSGSRLLKQLVDLKTTHGGDAAVRKAELLGKLGRVRLNRAAEVLALALPVEKFEGYPVVLTVMNEALRQKGQKYALVCVGDEEKRNVALDAIRGAGFEVIEVSSPSQNSSLSHRTSFGTLSQKSVNSLHESSVQATPSLQSTAVPFWQPRTG